MPQHYELGVNPLSQGSQSLTLSMSQRLTLDFNKLRLIRRPFSSLFQRGHDSNFTLSKPFTSSIACIPKTDMPDSKPQLEEQNDLGTDSTTEGPTALGALEPLNNEIPKSTSQLIPYPTVETDVVEGCYHEGLKLTSLVEGTGNSNMDHQPDIE